MAGYGDLVYDLFLWIFNVVVDIFFREIHPRSTWRVPRKGPVIFVAAPHANQFVDPLILMRTVRQDAKRRIAFLIAEKSMRRAFIGFAASLVGSVPVGRALDSKKPAKGKIYLPDPEGDPTLIRGNGVDFKDEKVYQVGGLLVLPTVNQTAANAEIKEIVSENEIRLKKPFKAEVAIKQLTGQDIGEGNGHLPGDVRRPEEKSGADFEGTSFSVAPHIDQSAVYDAVFKRIRSGGCIGIFPEGGSHDRTELLPLKAGLAIMALGALAEDPTCGVTIVPVGMNYFHAHKFRSRAVIEFGAPIEIDPELVERYRNGDRRAPVQQLLETVYDRLTAVTTLAPDYDTLMLIQAVRRLYNPKGKRLPLPMVVELNRRLIKGYTVYKDDPRIVQLRKDVLDYNRTLFRLNIRDHQVSYAKFSWPKVVATLVYRTLKLAVLSLAVLPGVILFAPVFIAGKAISKIKAKEALAASTVKIRARDVVATWKILVALALTPVLDLFYTSMLVYWTHMNRVVAVGGIFFFPSVCFGSLRFGEIGMDIFKSLRPLWLSINPTSANTLVQLRKRRERLQHDINEIINELGPELFPDFDRRRIVHDPEEVGGEPGSPVLERSRPSTPQSPQAGFDTLTFTPATPPAPGTLQRSKTPRTAGLPRNESFADIGKVGIFASRPNTPNRSRSRTNSHDGARFGGSFSFTSINSGGDKASGKADMDEVSKNLHAAMRERGKRRQSSGPGSNGDGAWEIERDSTGGPYDVEEGSSTTEGGDIMTPSSDFEPEEAKKDI
ncbi:putative acyltransferase [Teratosphaeria destructans]|uniref:Acyltransferase n=1 Tax=Teratosphaeria destructans TaxID=418781 RepID=A0A9W7SUK9_9PEZI|nr:putative acyltransferase [Teratosphaeria destructans]